MNATHYHGDEGENAKEQAANRRARFIDRAIIVGVALITAVLSTYYTNIVTMGTIQTDIRVHSVKIDNLTQQQADLSAKVDKLRIDQSGEDKVREEIMRRLEGIERTQGELMRMLSQLLKTQR